MRVMTLGGLGASVRRRRGLGAMDRRGYVVLLIAPLMTIGLLGTIMYLHRRSFRRR